MAAVKPFCVAVFIVDLMVYFYCTLALGNVECISVSRNTTPSPDDALSLSQEATSSPTKSVAEASLSGAYFPQLPADKFHGKKTVANSFLEKDSYVANHGSDTKSHSGKRKKIENDTKTCCKKSKASKRASKRLQKNIISLANEIKPLSCGHVDGYYDHKLLKMVTSCPWEWTNQTTRQHCQKWDKMRFTADINKLAILPVQDGHGTVFANVFCAICHVVDTVYPWTTSVDCDADQTVFDTNKNDIESDDSSAVMFNFSDISFLMELSETTSCRTKITPAFPDAIQSCLFDKTFDPHTFMRLMRPLSFDYGETSSPTVSFNILLNFDFKGDSHILFSSSQQVIKTEYIRLGRCDEGEAFDTMYKRCRPLKCNKPFYRLMGDSCVLDQRYTSEETNIFDNPYFDETALMSLSINITMWTYAMFTSLDNLNELLTTQLAGILNIGEDRIQHTNVTFDFRATQGTKAEIHRLNQLTPDLKQKLHIEGWDFARYQYGLNDNRDDFKNGIGESQGAEFVDDNDEVEIERVLNSIKSTVNENPPPIGAAEELTNSEIKEGNSDKQETGGDKSWTEIDPFSSPTNISTDNSAGTTEPNLRVNESFKDDTPTESSRHTTSFDDWGIPRLLDFISQPMTMYISFILSPAKHPQLSDERTPTLVKKISHLIRNNALHISVKGEQLNISGLHNTDKFDVDHDQETKFCQWGRPMVLRNNKLNIVEIKGTPYLHDTVQDKYFKQGLFNYFAFAKGENNKTATSLTYFEQFSYVCVMPRISHADCRRIELKADEYKMERDNKSIVFQGKEYNMSMYTVQNITSGLVEICVPKSYHYDTHLVSPRVVFIDTECSSMFEHIRSVESYITVILGRISSTALALVFLTYCLFSSLRTLPGCNIMNLTVALLFAEFVFMEDILLRDDDLCTVVTVILHFLFLVAHFWMNVISFDVYRTFVKRKRTVVTRQDSVGKRSFYFPRYFVYAWGTPLVIVSICIFIEYSNVFDVDIGYKKGQAKTLDLGPKFRIKQSDSIRPVNISVEDGNNTGFLQNASIVEDFPKLENGQRTCWIQKPVVALVAFGAPVLLIFLTNCVFFIKTILTVSRTVKLTRENLNRQESSCSIGKRSGRSEALLYLRMSTVMGFTWVFGFASAIISSVARPITTTVCTLAYVNSILFNILNISQGVFIFVAFMCNRRIMLLYVKLFVRIKRIFLRRSHSSTVYSISSAKGVDLDLNLKTE